MRIRCTIVCTVIAVQLFARAAKTRKLLLRQHNLIPGQPSAFAVLVDYVIYGFNFIDLISQNKYS